MLNHKKAIVLSAGFLALASCSSSGDTGGTARETLELNNQQAEVDKSQDLRAFCPKTIIRDGTELFRTFSNGVSKDDPDALSSLKFQATITETVRECNYTVNNLNVRVGVRGRAINGPTGTTGTFNAPIRIAMTTVDNNVVYSKLHDVAITIPDGTSNTLFSFVDGDINVPVPEKANLVIYVGFDEGPPS